jgi:tetratricopeptide (TPR) repeat protein
VASQIHSAFHNEPNSIRKFCPPCWEKRDAANSYIYLATYVALGLVGFVLAFQKSHWGFLLLTFFLFHLFGIVATLPHELGHALAARAFGMHVFQVAVGVGKKLFHCRILGVIVEFRAIPYGGVTMALSAERNSVRLRQFVYALAGPLANLLVALLVLALIGWDRIADFRPHEKISPWTLFFAANALVFITNLIPRSFPSPAGQMVSDGVHLLRAFIVKPEDYDETRIAYYLAHSDEARDRCDMRAAAGWTQQGLKEYPTDTGLLVRHGQDLIEAQDFAGAREVFLKLLQDSDQANLAFRAVVMDHLAYTDTLIGGKELLDEADDYSQDALKLLPWASHAKGTRGAVLVVSGKPADAAPLLQTALRETQEPWLRARYACVLAIADASRGNRETAREYLRSARQVHPDCVLIARTERMLAEPGGPSHIV